MRLLVNSRVLGYFCGFRYKVNMANHIRQMIVNDVYVYVELISCDKRSHKPAHIFINQWVVIVCYYQPPIGNDW